MISIKAKIVIPLLLFLILAVASRPTAQDIEARSSIRGRVTDLFGRTLDQGAFGVQLESDPGPPPAVMKFYFLDVSSDEEEFSCNGRLEKTVSTDANGNYRVDKLRAGRYRINVFVPGLSATDVWFAFLPGQTELTLDIEVPVGVTHALATIEVQGVVRGSKGEPIKDATITLLNPHNTEVAFNTRTNGAGHYRLSGMQPGQYLISVSKPSFALSATAVVLVRGIYHANFKLSHLPDLQPAKTGLSRSSRKHE